MATPTVLELVAELSPGEQEAVRAFVEYLRRPGKVESPFVAAAEEFMREHPELLTRLAQ